MLEYCCACEQVTADLHVSGLGDAGGLTHAMSQAWSRLSVAIAEAVLFDERRDSLLYLLAAAADEARQQRETWSRSAALSAVQDDWSLDAEVPECFSRDLVEFRSYGRQVAAEVARLSPEAAILVGIRTSGSYLAPVWAAAVSSLARPVLTLTARPKRDPNLTGEGEFSDPGAQQRFVPPREDRERVERWLSGVAPERALAVVMDDIAFTGASYVRVENYLLGLGLRRDHVVFSQGSPLLLRGLTAEARDRLADREVFVTRGLADSPEADGAAAAAFFQSRLRRQAGEASEYEVTSVRMGPQPFMQQFVAAHCEVPSDEVRHFSPRARDRVYLIDCQTPRGARALGAKVFGTGALSTDAFQRLHAFADVGYRALALADGFLLYEWVDGEPLGLGSGAGLNSGHVIELAEYAAVLAGVSGCGRMPPDALCQDVLKRLDRVAADKPGHEDLAPILGRFSQRARDGVPVVRAPRNQPHWHYIRRADGAIRRVHLDQGEWSWVMDVAEEVASTIVELGLSRPQAELLLREVVRRTGDEGLPDRLELGALSYVARVLDNYAYWEGLVAQLPTPFQRAAEDGAGPGYFDRRRVAVATLHAVGDGCSALDVGSEVGPRPSWEPG